MKLCRDVVEKRVACLDSNGKTTLRMREATILPCPIGKDIVPQNEAVTKLCEDESWDGTNKKPRLIMKNVNTQPQN